MSPVSFSSPSSAKNGEGWFGSPPRKRLVVLRHVFQLSHLFTWELTLMHVHTHTHTHSEINCFGLSCSICPMPKATVIRTSINKLLFPVCLPLCLHLLMFDWHLPCTSHCVLKTQGHSLGGENIYKY